jgi:predicted flavoprotein YhiN
MAEQFADPGKASRSIRALLLQTFSPKAVDFFLSQAIIQAESHLDALDETRLKNLLRVATDNRFKITGAGDFSSSQVSVGGVPVGEVDARTCQSLLVPGLYLVGETIDVAGPCGGYNLHYAFGSGILAGKDLAGNN